MPKLTFLPRLVAAAMLMATLAAPFSAQATTAVVYGNIDTATAAFNATVTATGTTPRADVVKSFFGTTYTGNGYTVTGPTGRQLSASPYTIYNSSPTRTLTGSAFDISPSSPTGTGHGDGSGIASGIQFNFSTGVNAIGFEVGDWATCCQESDLYISFDGGAAIQVGKSTVYGDQFLTNGGAGVFVSALDDTGTFSTVNFWGDGFGEFLVAGGTIRSAVIGTGTLPVVDAPEPASMTLLMGGVAGLIGMRMRRNRAEG